MSHPAAVFACEIVRAAESEKIAAPRVEKLSEQSVLLTFRDGWASVALTCHSDQSMTIRPRGFFQDYPILVVERGAYAGKPRLGLELVRHWLTALYPARTEAREMYDLCYVRV